VSVLEVPGARLYYETRGNGPLLVMIPGANGDARVFTGVADYLQEHYTVVTYDRRGFSRSPLVGPQDYDRRVEIDADDVHRLIEHLDGTTLDGAAAAVFGTSSGAVVALTVLARHPRAVRSLVAYEPATVSLLPDGSSWMDRLEHLYKLYRRRGVVPARDAFAEHLLTPGDRAYLAHMPDPAEHLHANTTYWFERELRQYPAAKLDLDTLAPHAERIVLLAGRDSRGYPAYEVTVELSRMLGRELVETPGGHIAAGTHPLELSRTLHHALSAYRADDPALKHDQPGRQQ
jgi:pimeloyl-ACP methyl ester carboxylesterase